MRKGIIWVSVLLALLMMFGCGKDQGKKAPETEQSTDEKEDTAVHSAETASTSQETQESAGQTDSNESILTENNTSRVYPGADKLAQISMGAYSDGGQKALCRIKMPDNYYISSLSMDETGQANNEMLETNGRLLSDVVSDNSLKASPVLPATVILTSQGKVLNTFTYVIAQSSMFNVKTAKEFASDGEDISSGQGHDAYIYNTSGTYDLAMVYEINSDWTLLIGNSGELKEELSLEEIGQELYDLITLVE